MRSRKTAVGPPGWMIAAASPPGFDASGPHMRAHIQSLANLDKEVLAEKLFHSKVQVTELLTENVSSDLLLSADMLPALPKCVGRLHTGLGVVTV